MTEERQHQGELTVGSDGVSAKGSAYDDLQPVVQGVVGIASPFLELMANLTGLSIGWVNRKLAVIGAKYEQKLARIPAEFRQLPPLEISASVVREAAVSSDAEELQELFSELLAAASDERRVDETHPSFGSFIRELEPLDAKLISLFRNLGPRSALYLLEATKNLNLHPRAAALSVSVSNLLRLAIVKRSSGLSRYDLSAFRGTHRIDNPEQEINELRADVRKAFEQLTEEPWPLCLTPIGERFVASCIAGSSEFIEDLRRRRGDV